jgi:hypothetical protein
MPIERRAWVTRKMLRAEPDTLFVFGDNIIRTGFGGQAREMRGEPNAVGLPTKKTPSEFLKDDDLALVRGANLKAIDRLSEHLRQDKLVVWPLAGIGTGLAELDKRAPAIAAYYEDVLEMLKGCHVN